MRSKTEIFAKGADAHLREYSIFSRLVYDQETGGRKTQIPQQWSTKPGFVGGQTYLSSDVIRSIDKNYQLYAVWPDVYVKLIYNYFDLAPEVSSVLSGAVAELKVPKTRGFKGWLDKDGILHEAGSKVTVGQNTNFYVSACYDLSLSYDLNGGYLAEGTHASTQVAQYSKWLSSDTKVYDIDAVTQIVADDPLNKNGSFFSCWKVGSQSLHRGDVVSFETDVIAQAQWLFNHNYTFYELCSFNGVAPTEKYGEIDVMSESFDGDMSARVYRATAEEGYQFNKWEVTTFDGIEVSPPQVLEDREIEVAICRVPAAEKHMELYARTVAYFSYDDSWSVVYNTSEQAIRRARIVGLATNAALGTKNDTSVKKVILGDKVTSIDAQLFLGCSRLEIVKMDNVTSIGDYAFSGCSKLLLSEMPSGLQVIGAEAFMYVSSLKRVSFKQALRKIGRGAFANSSASEIVFETSGANLEVDPSAFTKTKIKKIEFPVSCIKVGEDVVYGCNDLTEVAFCQTSLGGIDDNALHNAPNVEVIRLKGLTAKDIMG